MKISRIYKGRKKGKQKLFSNALLIQAQPMSYGAYKSYRSYRPHRTYTDVQRGHYLGEAEAAAGGRPVLTDDAAEFGPRLAVVGAGNDYGITGGKLVIGSSAKRRELEAVHFKRTVAAGGFHLDPDLRPGDIDRGGVIVIQRVLAFPAGEDALGAGGYRKPAGHYSIFDAVGDQLRREVVVISAGLERRAAIGKIAVSLRVSNQRGGEVFLGISGIDSDAARVLLRVERAQNGHAQ
jgi:hypothetical protein